KASVSSSWNEDASATTVVPAASVPGSEVSAVPTLPATFTGRPASRHRWPTPYWGRPASRYGWPISSPVVVFPLEPVTAMNSCSPSSRHPVSYSPSTGIPRSRGGATTGASRATPALAGGRDAGRARRRAGSVDQAAGAVELLQADGGGMHGDTGGAQAPDRLV